MGHPKAQTRQPFQPASPNCQWYLNLQAEKKYMAEKQEADQAGIVGHMIQHYLLWFAGFCPIKQQMPQNLSSEFMFVLIIDSWFFGFWRPALPQMKKYWVLAHHVGETFFLWIPQDESNFEACNRDKLSLQNSNAAYRYSVRVCPMLCR